MAIFYDLSQELQHQIFSYLDYAARLSLSQVSIYFRTALPTRAPQTLQEKRTYLCEKETWPSNKEYFACSQCLQLVHYSHFSSGKVRGRHGKLAACRDRRVCFRCLDRQVNFLMDLNFWRGRQESSRHGLIYEPPVGHFRAYQEIIYYIREVIAGPNGMPVAVFHPYHTFVPIWIPCYHPEP
ncbi:hypothetical protein BDV28DRAFT_151748 [Aspergillus coremiiformis]|uniref:F-box domain-containing protein n=1 Tax=Aspergillus coremiiformis TaxID=138285 RepID=A0A5N6YVY5_9EURO|nr:hypothetical protein BDV28DRAFT_151748 [Aspergillus coremiiformis]